MSAVNWCFTWNNFESMPDYEKVKEDVRYLVYQEEKGESGTPHLQGFLQLNVRQRLSFVKKLFGDKVHWEKARAPVQAIAYCKKEDSRVSGPYEFGEFQAQGTRTDSENCARKAASGASRDEVIAEFPVQYLRYSNGVERLIDNAKTGARSLPKVFVYCGGDFKSRARVIKEYMTSHESYLVPDTKTWGGYKGQECLIFKAIPKDWNFDKIQHLCSDLPFEMDRKYGHDFMTSSIFVFVLECATIFDDIECDDMKLFFYVDGNFTLFE